MALRSPAWPCLTESPKGVFAGLWHKTAVFEITEKGATEAAPAAATVSGVDQAPAVAKPATPVRPASGPPWAGVREEALLLIGLLSCVGAMAWTRLPNHLESAMWMTILVLQAVPYLAAITCAGLSALPEFRTRTARNSARQASPTAGASLGLGLSPLAKL